MGAWEEHRLLQSLLADWTSEQVKGAYFRPEAGRQVTAVQELLHESCSGKSLLQSVLIPCAGIPLTPKLECLSCQCCVKRTCDNSHQVP